MTKSMTSVLVVALSAIAANTYAASPKTMAEDRAHRDAETHWPKAFDPAMAPVFSHNELLIRSDCHRAFSQMVDALNWPNWFLLVKDVSFEKPNEPIKVGTRIHLKIFNSPIISRVDEFVPDSRLSWSPIGGDETDATHGHYHTWRFVPEAGGCRVITEETGIGPNDRKDPEGVSSLMHRAHDLWLASLRYVSEQ